MIVRSTPDLDWRLLSATAREGNIEPATALSLQLARTVLGAPVPDKVIREMLPPPVTRFHLAVLRPGHGLLRRLAARRFAVARLLEFWLLGGTRQRWSWLGGLPGPGLGLKLCLVQGLAYATALTACATRSGRSELRFWSGPARG
jgi:hypothetical protein